LTRLKYSSDAPRILAIITAYDPYHEQQAYQLDCSLPDQSTWVPRSTLVLVAKPRKFVDSFKCLLPSFNSTASPLRILELCSGSASFSNFASSMFPSAEIVTLDIDKKFAPTHVDDILTWNYLEHYPANYFHIIWGSPPCTEYSHAKTRTAKDPEHADAIVQSVLHIFEIAQPTVWFLENPHTSLFKRPFMEKFEPFRHTCSYCFYGCDYKKPTDIWSNCPIVDLRLCSSQTPCPLKLKHDNKHPRCGQQGTSHDGRSGISQAEANSVPSALCTALLHAALSFVVHKQ